MSQRWLTIAILLLVLLATAFLLPLLQSPLLGLNGLTVALVLVLLFGDTKLALVAGIAGGFFLDLISAFPFGMYMVSFVSMLMVSRQVNHTWVTNRSLVAYVSLTIIGMALFHLCTLAYVFFGSLLDPTALSMPIGRTLLVTGGADVLRGLVIAMCVYVVVRLTGHSYATLTRHGF
jgi:hypothetical protein